MNELTDGRMDADYVKRCTRTKFGERIKISSHRTGERAFPKYDIFFTVVVVSRPLPASFRQPRSSSVTTTTPSITDSVPLSVLFQLCFIFF